MYGGTASVGSNSLPPGARAHASPGAQSADAAEGKLAPRCWRTVYLLLDLYANMPDAETITHRSVSSSSSADNLSILAAP